MTSKIKNMFAWLTVCCCVSIALADEGNQDTIRRDTIPGQKLALAKANESPHVSAKKNRREKPVSIFTASGLTDEQRMTVLALQGLANRKGPKLILSNSNYWSDGAWNLKWIEIYQREYGLQFQKIDGLMDLLRTHRDDYEGLAVYDPAINGTCFLALTLAGLDNLLPVAEPQEYVEQLGLEIKHDLRGRFPNSVAAYRWALKHLMPRCNRQYAHASAGPDVDGKYIGWGFEGYDYCIMNKGFLFNLSFSVKDKMSFQSRTIQGDAQQAALYRDILTALDKPAYVVGYGEPEIEWFALIGEYGHHYLHWGDNLSFHAQVPAHQNPIRQKKHIAPEGVTLEQDKYYVSFVMSEGDSMKGPLTFFFDSWFEKERGRVPITWPIPQSMRRFPAMLEYYYATATPNDYFAACSIYNYNMPNVEQLARTVKTMCEEADLSCLAGAFNFPSDKVMAAKEKFFNIIDPLGVYDIVYEDCPAYGYQSFMGENDNVPLVGTAFIMGYWHRLLGGWDVKWQDMLKDPEQYPQIVTRLSDEIIKIANQHPTPFVVLVYGDLHKYDEHNRFYRDVADSLDQNKFKVVRLDEAFSALRKWNTPPKAH